MLRKIHTICNSIFHQRTIFYQIIMFTLITSILPLFLLIFMTNQKTNELIDEDMIGSYKQMQAQYMSNIEYKFSLYESSIRKIAGNSVILDALYDGGQAEYGSPYERGIAVSREIGNFLSLDMQTDLTNCRIYSFNEEAPVFGTKVTMHDIAAKESWYAHYRQMADSGYFVDTNKSTLSLIRNIEYIDTKFMRSETVGFVKLDIKMSEVFAPTAKSEADNFYYDVVVMDYNNTVMYATNGLYVYDEELYDRLTGLSDTGSGMYDHGDYICAYSQIEPYPVQVMFFFHIGELLRKKTDIRNYILLVMAVSLVFIVATSFMFSKSFNRRVFTLISKMQKAETGDMEITEYVGGNDEITRLDVHFNRMLSKLNDLINKNYIQQMENRETQIRNLKLQINPHFLYNTLETIGSIAAVNGVMLAANISEKLGEIFRYSLESNYRENVTVKQELLHTQNYIYIQKVRYGDKFTVSYDVSGAVSNNQIMRLIMQPIVENAIMHGLIKAKRQGRLDIAIYPNGDRLILKIADDGVGMELDTVERLKVFINKSDIRGEEGKNGIGIRNVNQRIKMACGAEYGITIDSAPGEGTCFTIVLPLH